MIRSGLTNVQKAGYLGYPHERDRNSRNAVERPFVSVGDATVLHKSDFSDPMAYTTVTPSPVLYNDIFAKRTTADERLYVLKQIQQGLSKIQKGLLGKDVEQVKGVPLPNQPGQIIPTPPFGGQPGAPGGPGGPNGNGGVGGGDGAPPAGGAPAGPAGEVPTVPGGFPNLITESPTSEYYLAEDGVGLATEELAQDVVANPPAPTPQSEEERAAEEWLHMQHSPQWAQIEGRTFNSNITTPSGYSPIYPSLSPLDESLGAYGPNTSNTYAPKTVSPRSAISNQIVTYPTVSQAVPSSRSDGHSFKAKTSSSSSESGILQGLETLPISYSPKSAASNMTELLEILEALPGPNRDNPLTGFPLTSPIFEQLPSVGTTPISGVSSVSLPSVPYSGKFQGDALYHFRKLVAMPAEERAEALKTYHPKNIEFLRKMGDLQVQGYPINIDTINYLVRLPQTASPVTPSPKSTISSTVSSNGVGPRRRESGFLPYNPPMVLKPVKSYTTVLVDPNAPKPIPSYKKNRPPPINTVSKRRAATKTATNYMKPGRPRVAADLERYLARGLRPQQRRNYLESPPS
jgi:hypothetical protein